MRFLRKAIPLLGLLGCLGLASTADAFYQYRVMIVGAQASVPPGWTSFGPGTYQVTVPAGVTTATANLTGAGGGGGTYAGAPGGGFAGSFPVSPGETLTVIVGARGPSDGYDGAGGGATMVCAGLSCDASDVLLEAGGGGGAIWDLNGDCGLEYPPTAGGPANQSAAPFAAPGPGGSGFGGAGCYDTDYDGQVDVYCGANGTAFSPDSGATPLSGGPQTPGGGGGLPGGGGGGFNGTDAGCYSGSGGENFSAPGTTVTANTSGTGGAGGAAISGGGGTATSANSGTGGSASLAW
ncbi:hypothetical protein [Thiomonas sp.]